MAEVIRHEGELLRINYRMNSIEFSVDEGLYWDVRSITHGVGRFIDLLSFNGLVFACTSRGLYYSNNAGNSWQLRCLNSTIGEFDSLSSDGFEMQAKTTRGRFYSVDNGRTWHVEMTERGFNQFSACT